MGKSELLERYKYKETNSQKRQNTQGQWGRKMLSKNNGQIRKQIKKNLKERKINKPN